MNLFLHDVYFSYDEKKAEQKNFFDKLGPLEKILHIIMVAKRHHTLWKN